MKKLIFVILALIFASNPVRVLAEEIQIICPQAYGGGVVCGVHTPVETGLGDNLAIIGGVLLISSLIFLVLSKRFKKVTA
jgi:LPXTG-motif cell wall-anchored protein